jgi:hypothetical protein
MAPEELPGMTEFVVLSTLLGPEVFRIPRDSAPMGGLAPSVDFLLLLEQELSIPWRPLLERRLGRRLELPLRLKQPAHNSLPAFGAITTNNENKNLFMKPPSKHFLNANFDQNPKYANFRCSVI